MIIKSEHNAYANPNACVSLRCPGCRQIGTFQPFSGVNDLTLPNDQKVLGQRQCPNSNCKAQVFFVYCSKSNRLVAAYPPELIDFDSTNIPDQVGSSLQEAIACHASGCFRACALMVRRTLEELCRDRKAQGENLKARVKNLRNFVILPDDLLNGLDELRLLGNDAAHVESQDYNNIGQAEVELGISVAKEVLKAVYQYSALVKKLQSLKKTP